MSIDQGGPMQGRRALAVLLAAAAIGGCGEAARVEPVKIEIAAPAPAPPPGEQASGTVRTAQLVPPPPPSAGTAIRPAARRHARSRRDERRFRAGQLEVLRAHCAARPDNDPRCDGTRVNERVAFAAHQR